MLLLPVLSHGQVSAVLADAIIVDNMDELIIESALMNDSPLAEGWIGSIKEGNYVTINNGSILGGRNLTYKMSNGGLILDYQTNYDGMITFQGVVKGDAAANSSAIDVGRFVFSEGTFVAKGELFFKDALQVTNAFGPTILSSNLTVQSGETAFQGEATTSSKSLSSDLIIGASDANTLTINNGATATMDLGFRTDAEAVFFSGIILNASTIINGGGTLQFTQTAINKGSTYDSIEVNSSITGQGTEKTGEVILKIQDSIAVGSNLLFGPGVNLYVQGSGINGLRVEGGPIQV